MKRVCRPARVFATAPWRRTEWVEYKQPQTSGRVGIGAPDYSGCHSGATIQPTEFAERAPSDLELLESGLLAREQKARQESNRRRSMLAPLYSKGPVMYIGGIEDSKVIQDLGKKL